MHLTVLLLIWHNFSPELHSLVKVGLWGQRQKTQNFPDIRLWCIKTDSRFWAFLAHILCANFSGSKFFVCYFINFFHLSKLHYFFFVINYAICFVNNLRFRNPRHNLSKNYSVRHFPIKAPSHFRQHNDSFGNTVKYDLQCYIRHYCFYGIWEYLQFRNNEYFHWDENIYKKTKIFIWDF